LGSAAGTGVSGSPSSRHDVAAVRDGSGLIERNLAIAALAPEFAIAVHNQAAGGDVLQRSADLTRDVFGPIGLQYAVADGADGDLLLEIVLEGPEQLQVRSFISRVHTSPRKRSM